MTDIAPKVYGIINVKNRLGIVYEKINGEMLSDYLSRNLKNVRTIVSEFAQTQKIINDINFENFPNHTNKLKQKIMGSSLLYNSEKEIILKYLKTINKNEICHGDYHPENVFVDQNYNYRVIDWANMFVSNKYIDIAKTYYLIKLGKSLNRKSKPGELIEWLGRQFITKLYWEEVKTEKNRRKYFLPCLFIVILIRYDENIEREKKWIHNYVMKNKKKILKNMDIRKDIN
ncbi:MAG: hypothetical protein SCARUB_04443 [Candidatus Scalindua rubra]|uniref:Aminoglycoside phosphotransferase domain-containing protein n=1 Tax=Candidatus Scalindua rubra TaxID=1872076 RepID=A0A1E3X462_9BACT|nr:MAG: hypothetical protein SCARUB_04443 [Candidatus Scalindua rubra]